MHIGTDTIMDQSDMRRLKVLFLASWFPNREYPVSGIFVKKHAIAVSKYCDVSVLHIHIGSIENKVEVIEEDGLLEVMIYRNMNSYPYRLLEHLSKLAARYFAYLHCTSIGYRIINKMKGRPDITHSNILLWAGAVALYLKYRYNIPYIITEHWSGYIEEDGTFNRYSKLNQKIVRFIGKRAATITAVSRKLMDGMVACGIENNYLIIPNVVDVAEIKCIPRRNNIKQILHVSIFGNDIKNVSGIIGAIKDLSIKRRDFELHIIGDGDDRPMLEKLAEECGLLNEVVFFEGMKDAIDVARFYHGCDFFVLNSNFETFSVVTAEALVCGKPVIATRCGGPEEYVTDDCGILIEPKDHEALVKAMDFMLDNYSSYDSKKISDYAKSKFGYYEIGEKFLQIYQKVLQKQIVEIS